MGVTLDKSNMPIIVGTDEVGRGPLAGPVVAAAVILNSGQRKAIIEEGLDDSKKLSPKKRKLIFSKLESLGVIWKAQAASPAKIDRINIYQASLWCMKRAVERLPVAPDLVLVDGNARIPNLTFNQRCIVRGDSKVPVIALASIIAKVLRDDVMCKLDRVYPEYDFASNKGYPSLKHRNKLVDIGPSSIHRLTFKGVLAGDKNVTG